MKATTFRIESAGYLDGNTLMVDVTGEHQQRYRFPRGIGVLTEDGRYASFDTHGDPSASAALVQWLQALPDGLAFAAGVCDAATNQLSDAARAAFQALGSVKIGEMAHRDSWGFIGRTGRSTGYAEQLTRAGQGDAVVTAELTPEGAPLESGPDLDVHVRSGGYDDGNTFSVSGLPAPASFQPRRGMNIVAEDGRAASFDTYADPNASAHMLSWLGALPKELVFAIGVRDEGSRALSDAARATFEAMGSASIRQLGHRDSWAAVGRMGQPWMGEQLSKRGHGAAELSVHVSRAALIPPPPPKVPEPQGTGCYRFGGESYSRVSIENFTGFGSPTFTVELWLKANSGRKGTLLSYAVGDNNGRDNAFVFEFGADGKPAVRINNNLWTPTTGVPSIAKGRWVHVALEWTTATGQVRVFLDGASSPSAKGVVSVGVPIRGDGWLMLGQEQDKLGGGLEQDAALHGELTEIRLWNRTLSGAERRGNMNQRLCGGEAGLIGYWPLTAETDTGLSAFDENTNGPRHSGLRAAMSDSDVKGIGSGPPSLLNYEAFLALGGGSSVVARGYRGILGQGARTVEAWVLTTKGNGTLVSWGGHSGAKSRWAFQIDSGGKLKVNTYSGRVTGTTPVADGRWHHVACTYGGQGQLDEVKLYVDGKLDPIDAATTANSAVATAEGADVKLGIDDYNTQLKGSLCEVRIWSVERTAAQIQETMSIRIEDDQRGLEACWPLTSGARDVTSDPHDGTLQSCAWTTLLVRPGLPDIAEESPSPAVIPPPDSIGEVRKSDWMGSYRGLLGGKRLRGLCLPGTHDTACYRFDNKLGGDAKPAVVALWTYLDMGGSLGMRKFIKKMALTQSLDVPAQLRAGVRYLDLRFYLEDGVYYATHTLRADPLILIADQINAFLHDHPLEVVVVKLDWKGGMSSADAKAGEELLSERISGSVWGTSHFESTLDALVSAGTRAVFFSADDRKIAKSYEESVVDKDDIVEALKAVTINAAKNNHVPALAFHRPIPTGGDLQDDEFVVGYIQKHGCKVLGVFSALMAVPGVPVLLGPYGITSAAAVVQYLDKCQPLATDLRKNARHTRSIVRRYFEWWLANEELDDGAEGKEVLRFPTLMEIDYFEDVEYVELAVAISTGDYAAARERLASFKDSPLRSKSGAVDFLGDCFECGVDGIVAAALAAGWAAGQAADLVVEYGPKVAKEALTQSLKGAGYAADEIVKGLSRAYNATIRECGELLGEVGYVADDVGRALNDAFDATAEELADALKIAGASVDATGRFLRDGAGLSKSAAKSAMKSAGYAGGAVDDWAQSSWEAVGGVIGL